MSRKKGCLLHILVVFCLFITLIYIWASNNWNTRYTIAEYQIPNTDYSLFLQYNTRLDLIEIYYNEAFSNKDRYLDSTETSFYERPRKNDYDVIIDDNIATIIINKDRYHTEIFEIIFSDKVTIVRL